jgi:molybdopterin-guanine dinucleotide biosynthesis protein A
MANAATAGILAGGAGSRMGANKALLSFRGQPLLARQLEVLRPLFARVIVGSNDPSPYGPFGVEVVPDVLSERCALTGIHALVSAARTDGVFVVACDLPYLNPRLIEDLLGRAAGADAVVPESDAGPEPLHAYYSRRCLPAMEESAARGEWKATAFLDRVRAVRPRVRDADWAVEGRSPFLNVNTPEELRGALP